MNWEEFSAAAAWGFGIATVIGIIAMCNASAAAAIACLGYGTTALILVYMESKNHD